jgi:Holliday junction DNA helicase RuvA
VTLLTHLAIRDDAHVLYGFSTETERDLFRQLIRHVSGIGPKIALNVLSGTHAGILPRGGGSWRCQSALVH